MRGAACCRARTPAHALSATDTKTYDVQGLQLGVSALYNYGNHTPYAGFILESTSGVSSAAKSNSFSINQAFLLEDLPVETKIEMQVRHAACGGGAPVSLKRAARHAGRGQAAGHQIRRGFQHGWAHRPCGRQVSQLDCDVHCLTKRRTAAASADPGAARPMLLSYTCLAQHSRAYPSSLIRPRSSGLASLWFVGYARSGPLGPRAASIA